MKISQRLAIIVCLTILEVSFTIWAALEISSGATFHRLNFLHLKYETVFSEELQSIKSGKQIDAAVLTKMVNDVRQQPVDCLNEVNFIDRWIMKAIDTDIALQTCEKDVQNADLALANIRGYQSNELSEAELIVALEKAGKIFVSNSVKFEAPIAKTVDFILKTLIPLIILISMINIGSIIYLSTAITTSIRQTIEVLLNDRSEHTLSELIKLSATGELRELMQAAEKRIRRDLETIELNDQLEEQVAERTKLLTQANDELAQFAYRASHDLKAPLSSTKGLSMVIDMDIAAGNYEEARSNASKITNQMEVLERLIVDILALARADLANEQVVGIDIESVISDVIARHAAEVESSGINVDLDLQTTPRISASRGRIVQIIENLVANAVKYHDPAKDNRYVKVGWNVEDGMASICVEDNGLGIPSSRQEELFELFKRFHPEIGSGSGLGLSIVKKHVDKMNGSITCTSSEAGTVFKVVIPEKTRRDQDESIFRDDNRRQRSGSVPAETTA